MKWTAVIERITRTAQLGSSVPALHPPAFGERGGACVEKPLDRRQDGRDDADGRLSRKARSAGERRHVQGMTAPSDRFPLARVLYLRRSRLGIRDPAYPTVTAIIVASSKRSRRPRKSAIARSTVASTSSAVARADAATRDSSRSEPNISPASFSISTQPSV